MSAPRHFLDLKDYDGAALRRILDRALAFKAGDPDRPLEGKTLAMIFEQPSTRTRVSFEVAMRQLGGHVIVLSGQETQVKRGESWADTARVLSRYVDAIMIRTDSHDKLTELAANAEVPVINGLTDRSHPCQLMADVMTFEEQRGAIAGKRIAWSGDGNNVATSWIHAAARFDFDFAVGCPPERRPPADALAWAEANGARVSLHDDPAAAVSDAHAVVTDVWVSMNDGGENSRHNLLAPYRVDERLMAGARPDAIFLHCLPAHRGEEVSGAVIDGPQSVVWDEAENRLHAQKGILAWCLGR